MTRFLELDEHVVEVASNGREALAKLQAAATFDLVITDRAMPELGVDELAEMVKVLAPTTPVMMLTGFADLMEAADQRPAGVDLVVGLATTLARLRVASATLVPDPAPAPTYDRTPSSPAPRQPDGTILPVPSLSAEVLWSRRCRPRDHAIRNRQRAQLEFRN